MKQSSILASLVILTLPVGVALGEAPQADPPKSGFYVPENPDYTILDSARDSVRFAVWTLEPFKGHLASKSNTLNRS